MTRPGPGGTPVGTDAASPPLMSLLAHTSRLTDLLPHLHQYAIDTTGGSCSLLFEKAPGRTGLQPTSGFGLDSLVTDAWTPQAREAALVSRVLADGAPHVIADIAHDAPQLASRLGRRAALLIPLLRSEDRIALLTVGFDGPPGPGIARDAATVADAFIASLEISRLRQRDQLQQDLRELLTAFADSLSTTLNLSAGLDIFCHRANSLFGADRTSVWIHDRRSRNLALRASSDPAHAARGVRISTEDTQAPAAIAMRRARAEIIRTENDDAATSMVTVPLRGCRRALGTVVFEGVRVEPGGELDLLERSDELGRQVSGTIENMQLLDEVLRSRRELENTFDSIAHLVAVSDRRGRIVHVNEAFANRVGRSREQLLDRPLAEFVGHDLAAWLAAHEAAVVRPDGEVPPTFEVNDPGLNGPFMITVTDLLNQERERVGTVIVARDLTPQNKLEAEREELRKRLTQSEKLAALGQFVAGIAHELNNPLQGVLGHLELLRATGAFPKQLRREVQTIYREADRAAKIVRNLLVFAGSRRLARRTVSLNAVLQKVVALRAAACRAANIEVVRHYDEHLPRVKSDPLLLHQVFLNIVMNAEHAIAAAGDGGRIEITTSQSASGDRIIARVRDTGTGLAPDVVSHIFEPFYTTKEVGQGTGLGLAIAYGIIQEHGGDILASNHPEGGAIFTVKLPIAPVATGR
jgi:PAS domain S-box-containing protein